MGIEDIDFEEEGKQIKFESGKPFYSEAGDCIFIFFEDTEYYAERIDDSFTAYISEKDHHVIGLQIKSIKNRIEHYSILPMIANRNIPQKDRFMCPRRNEAGPWRQVQEDYWRQDYWEKGENWKLTFVPRACSFCGGINPEDAKRLIEMGWEIEPTTKGYKRYMHPKGYREYMNATLKSIKEKGDMPKDYIADYWEPKPPVKLYVMHFDVDQRKSFNIALKFYGVK